MHESEVELAFDTKMPRIVEYRQLPPVENKPPDPQYSAILDALVDKLNPHFRAWEKDEKFTFDCPSSTFSGGRDRPIIAYHQPGELDDRVEVQPLTPEQLECIKKDGTFFVKSNYFTIPYKWTISEWVYKGVESIKVQLRKDIAKGYMQLYEVPRRVTSHFVSLRKGVIRLLKYVPNLLNLLFGMRRGQYEQTNIEYELQFERETDIFKKVWSAISKDFYEYVRVPISPPSVPHEQAQAELAKARERASRRITKLRNVNDMFEKEWVQVRDDIEERFADDDPAANRLHIRAEKYKLMKKLLSERGFEEDANDRVKQDFFAAFDNMVIIMEASTAKQQKTERELKAFQESIDRDYPILRYAKNWRSDKVSDYREERDKANHQEFLQNIKERLNLPVFNLHCEYLQTAEERKKELERTLPKTFVPNREFRCPYKLFPPYKVERTPHAASPTGFTYYLVKEENRWVSTVSFGWKTALNFVRWLTWSINVMYWLFRGVWGGRLGIKVLFGCDTFYPRYSVDQYTGELTRSREISWDPIAVQLRHTWAGIARSRQSFEQAPDNGFFGKTCARFCNLVENYVFRLIIVCFFWLILIKPIVIVVNVVVCTLIAVTAILWIPIVIILYYLFGLFIYNFDLDQRHPSNRYSQRFFPLICGPLKFVYDLMYTLLALSMLVIHPILALLMLLSSFIRFIGRSIYDRFMYCVICCCGRSPVRDTAIAWKISGPGLSRQYFQSIREEDVYILMIAELEKMQLEHFQKTVKARLESLRTDASTSVAFLTKAVKTPPYTEFSTINESIRFYQEKLDKQLSKIRNKFPQYPGSNVRFTQAELTKYVASTNEIVRSFVAKHHQEHLFERFQLKKGDFQRLNLKLWEAIFRNEDIFEPFENLDERFELADDREDEFVKGVMLAIEGSVNLREGSHVPMLKFKKKQEAIDIYGPYIVLDSISMFEYKSLPASRHNISQSIFVNINFPDLLAERERRPTEQAHPERTIDPMSAADEF